MASIRPSALAGTFYPGDSQQLLSSVESYLSTKQSSAPSPKVIIAPHAGHIYSGAIAASAYSRLKNRQHEITRVILLGPAHKVAFKGVATSSASSFNTPLGDIPLATNIISALNGMPSIGCLDEAHAKEHSLEVHLPFLQSILGDFELVPLVVGNADKVLVAQLIEQLWGGPETLIIISSDLSHFHDYASAQNLDAQTAQKIITLQDTLIGKEACGAKPLNGLLSLVAKKGLTIEQVDIGNSGDTAGKKDRVVGYGSFVIYEDTNVAEEFSLAERQSMLQIARQAISMPLTGTSNVELNLRQFPLSFQNKRATFVTLNIDGKLRGCIGSLTAQRPLIVDITHNAQAAAFKDPRFKALSLDEFKQVDIHISVLTEAQVMQVTDRADLMSKLRPGIDGLIIKEGQKSATFLPSVWEKIPTAEMFVSQLRRKAGLTPKGWSDDTVVKTYQSIEFS